MNIYKQLLKTRCEVTYISDFFPTLKSKNLGQRANFIFLNKTRHINRTFPHS